MIEKIEALVATYHELEQQLGDPQVVADPDRYKKLAKRHAELGEIVQEYASYRQAEADLAGAREMAKDPDPDMRALAEEEIVACHERLEDSLLRLRTLLLPKDPLDEKNIIVEIRAGTGGEEAALFAADLFRMYSRFAESQRWKVEVLSTSETGTGGFKEIIASISGDRVYSRLKYESGVHRVQRVPETESQGRIHTSAVTVAVLPEAEEVDVHIDPSEIRVDVFRSSGPGGQSVNTTDSAIRITHLPTGIVVSCQDEKSQHKNKAKALKVLRSRLLQLAQEEAKRAYDETRKAQVGTGDRSERIRTYNFPQGRVTDHRINLTLYNLDQVMEGRLEPIIDALCQHYQAEALKAV
jgi:peptide chain release factor 1